MFTIYTQYSINKKGGMNLNTYVQVLLINATTIYHDVYFSIKIKQALTLKRAFSVMFCSVSVSHMLVHVVKIDIVQNEETIDVIILVSFDDVGEVDVFTRLVHILKSIVRYL